MKLRDFPMPPPLEDARGYALVFSSALAARLADVHRQYGTPNCVPAPTRMVDGRWMLCADILTEIGPDGLLAAMWEAADQDVLLDNVDVIPLDEALALMPEDPH
jgi:hypothetical protein